MDWEHINAFGRGVERVLCLVTVASVTVTLALLLLKFEWEHLPAEAREEIACGEEVAALALGFPGQGPEARGAAYLEGCPPLEKRNRSPAAQEDARVQN